MGILGMALRMGTTVQTAVVLLGVTVAALEITAKVLRHANRVLDQRPPMRRP